MRSLLVQASCVERAVEKAWAHAGMPTEFTIKIHDFGKKGFFGLTKKQAIISIIYEPQKQTAISKAPKPQQYKAVPPKDKRQTQPPRRQEKKEAPKQEPKKIIPKERLFWTDTLINDVSTWLRDITKAMGITSSFQIKSDRKALSFIFPHNVLPSHEEERYLFSGLSYLLIQFLKKKHKKKYQGYKLILTARRSGEKTKV